jgi:hypothetical protein
MPTKLHFTKVELINHKANNASTHPQFFLNFGLIGIGRLGCNNSNASMCNDICAKPEQNDNDCKKCRNTRLEEACLNPSRADLYKGCHR